ncbi:MAG: heavy metal translocating P-type ATPase [Candidatus Omnitrophica bacterium]|nr:heavy metal translocating P-type ATPase [Candidatus Omnitrophota bacterium]
MAIDPICGMQVDESEGLRLDRPGMTYFFCSKACLNKFEDAERAQAETPTARLEPEKKEVIPVVGMHCATCVATIEHALKISPGVHDAQVNLATEQAVVRYNPAKTGPEQLRRSIEKAGYKTVAQDKGEGLEEARKARAADILSIRVRFWAAFLLALPLVFLAIAAAYRIPLSEFVVRNNPLIQFVIATLVMFCGLPFFMQGLVAMLRTRRANMYTLVSVGVGTAYLYSVFMAFALWKTGVSPQMGGLYFETSGVLVAFVLLGQYLESSARGRTSDAIKKLIGLRPDTALVIRQGAEIAIPVEEVAIGDIVVVKPGERIAADGIVVDGFSSIDEAMVTGESFPVDKSPGKEVICGTVNKTGTFKFEAIRVGRDTMLAQIIAMVQDALGKKAPIQEVADTIAAVFVPTILVSSLAVFWVWLLLGEDFMFALNTLISMLIIACPCALGLATPTAVIVGTGIAAQNGILIKNPASLELAYRVTTVVFDKTGTLTRGRPVLTDYIGYHGKTKDEVLRIAASVEKNSEHPLAQAVVEGAGQRSIRTADVKDFIALPGKGVMARLDNDLIMIGNRTFLVKKNIEVAPQASGDAAALEAGGKTVMFVVANNKTVGLIAVGDTLKDFAVEAAAALRRMGKRVIMITGDNARTAETIAHFIGVDQVFSEVLPQEKEDKIKQLQAQGAKVAMVGDGINDAPALAQADIGIAIGSGTDIAIESGDIVLIKDDLRDVVTAIDLSRYAMKKIKQNLFWAFIYNLIGIPIAAGALYSFTGFLLNPMVAGAAMAFSSVSVVSNSLSMRRYRRPFAR